MLSDLKHNLKNILVQFAAFEIIQGFNLYISCEYHNYNYLPEELQFINVVTRSGRVVPSSAYVVFR